MFRHPMVRTNKHGSVLLVPGTAAEAAVPAPARRGRRRRARVMTSDVMPSLMLRTSEVAIVAMRHLCRVSPPRPTELEKDLWQLRNSG